MVWNNWSPGIPIRFDYRAQVLVAKVTRRTSLKSKRLLLHRLPVIHRKSPVKPKPTQCIFVGVSSSFSEQNHRRNGVPFVILISFDFFPAYPDYDGGSPVIDFEVQVTNLDNTSRTAYRGRDLDCTVAGLLPGRPYLFQVRAFNRAGVGFTVFFNWSHTKCLLSLGGSMVGISRCAFWTRCSWSTAKLSRRMSDSQ